MKSAKKQSNKQAGRKVHILSSPTEEPDGLPFLRESKMRVVTIKHLTIDFLKSAVKQHACFCIENQGGELFQHPESEEVPENSLLVDVQSANVLCVIYNALNDKHKADFNNVLQNEYKLASLIEKMWDWVSLKR